MRYLVAHVINSPAGAVRTARLVIDDVPDKTSRADVIEALTAHGDAARFSEAGIPFGNHDVLAEGRAGWPKGVAGIGEAEHTTWERLTVAAPRNEGRRLTVRLTNAEYAAITLAAQREAGGNLQKWCEHVLLTAASPEGGQS
jgi:hypothetical protein